MGLFPAKASTMHEPRTKGVVRVPVIMQLEAHHFVVLDGFRGNNVYLNDPAKGAVKVTWEEFDESFTGVVLIPTLSESFEPSGRRQSVLAFARENLTGAGAATAFVVIATAIAYLFGIVNSVTSRIFMDRLLTGINPDWLGPFTAALVGSAALQLVVAWIQAFYSLRINGKMSVAGSTNLHVEGPAHPYPRAKAGFLAARSSGS